MTHDIPQSPIAEAVAERIDADGRDVRPACANCRTPIDLAEANNNAGLCDMCHGDSGASM